MSLRTSLCWSQLFLDSVFETGGGGGVGPLGPLPNSKNSSDQPRQDTGLCKGFAIG